MTLALKGGPGVDLPPRLALLARALRTNWRAGGLTVILPEGRRLSVGEGAGAVLEVRDYRFIDRVAARGLTGFGEAYMAGEWDSPDIAALLLAFSRNLDRLDGVLKGAPLMRGLLRLFHAVRPNTRTGARRNIEAHYDLGNAFYALWLDPGMTYSAGRNVDALGLEASQREKYAALARLIDLQPHHSVLEIGCGWGGFAEYAAQEIGCRVTAATISPSQLAFARQRMAASGLSDRVEVRLADYRDLDGEYDRIVSIEMIEAVGEAYWPAYFSQVRGRLKPGGKAGLQVISIREDLYARYRRQTDFIQRHVFPGGMLPSPAALERHAAAHGLVVDRVETFADDYALTLGAWRERFDAAWPSIAPLGFDERFRRLWRFYLAYCEAGFRTGRTSVGQWVLNRVE